LLNFKHLIKKTLRPRGQRSFISSIQKENCNILDVGCGNNSIFLKSIKLNSFICGVDIDSFEQSNESKALYDNLIICEAENFAQSIQNIEKDFDIVISNHNIEHCNDPQAVFRAMVEKTKVDGMLFFSTPSLNSVNFPSRGGGLNFYDDSTHISPIDLVKLLESESYRLECKYYNKAYKPPIWWFLGLAQEYISKKRNFIMTGTYDYYGFEQIMWLQKIKI